MSSTPSPNSPKIRLYDSLTREKRDFTPIDPTNVGMYVCGVTPYDDSHIGHARGAVVFDVLFRLLRHVYGEDHVTYVRNFTDIDDKIIARAKELNVDPTALAQQHIEGYHADLAALNTLPPTHEPRVSTSMTEIVAMVDDLLARNMAYVTASGDVMFDVPAFEQKGGHNPFGTLARRIFDNLQARVEGDDEKRDPRDFPVWKANAKSATKLEQAFHPADLGALHFTAAGRPGWHIECSVMSKQHLGPTFDIHGGGEDLQFPHHCCEIVQSEALLPAGQSMANYWLHNGFITVNGTKMSKSLGNFTTIKDALQKYSPEAIRLWLLQTHYRKPVDYSDNALEGSSNAISNIKIAEEIMENVLPRIRLATLEQRLGLLPEPDLLIMQEFLVAITDDLNTSAALGILFKACKDAERIGYFRYEPSDDEALEADKAKLPIHSAIALMADILGLKAPKKEAWLLTDEQSEILESRKNARASKNWPESDRLRDLLKSDHGIIVEDGPTGQTWRRV